jgi:8-oxo-dGTP pyrophosphatase MutT (NUDIX family)
MVDDGRGERSSWLFRRRVVRGPWVGSGTLGGMGQTAAAPLIKAARVVKAAGGVVLKGKKTPKVLVVHRPKYDDWSLPKGKLNRGESWEAAAVREVLEETNVQAQIVDTLNPTSYWIKNRPKVVVWYLMEVVKEPRFKPNSEVDQVVWVPLDEARKLLTYRDERTVVKQVLKPKKSKR